MKYIVAQINFFFILNFTFLYYSDDGEREDSDNNTSPTKDERQYRDTLDNIN